MKTNIGIILLLTSLSAHSESNSISAHGLDQSISDRLPMEYWDYMPGYKYEYSNNCTVHWHVRTSTFLGGPNCQNISPEKLKSDAIKSINYAKSKSNAKNFDEYYFLLESPSKSTYTIHQANEDARTLWHVVCLQAKSNQLTSFSETYKQYTDIQFAHAARIYSNAVNTVRGTGGMLNCAEQARYAAELYTSDIDIRNKSTQ
ncbi:hypothetical protein [Kerstersia similis]|uniref:hypothetical protein n=1 Tax=Kerstersia similis TaxID=206505 RepID=UPI0039F090CE